MIFMTSDCIGAQAAQQYLDKLSYLPEKMQALCLKRVPIQIIIEKVMQRKFDPEFLNRIDRSLQLSGGDSTMPCHVWSKLNWIN